MLRQFCSSGSVCAHFQFGGFSFTDSFSAPHASFACASSFSWLFNHLSLAFSELSEIILVWGKVVNLSLILVTRMSHRSTPGQCDAFFSPFHVFVLENVSAFQVILPFLKILNVFSISSCLKLTQTR